MAVLPAPTLVTSSDVGAPTLNSQYNQFATVMDWILVTKAGWSVLQTATGKRVYQMPGGSQRCLYIDHTSTSSASNGNANSTYMAEFRGCEDATSASYAGLITPFPDIIQCPAAPSSSSGAAFSAAVYLSNLNNSATARWYAAYYTDRWVRLFFNLASNTAWDNTNASFVSYFYGDVVPSDPNDDYCTLIALQANVRYGSSTNLFTSGDAIVNCMHGSSAFSSVGNIYWCRDRTGVYKSVVGAYGRELAVVGAPAPAAGYLNKIRYTKLSATDSGIYMPSNTAATGAATKGILDRGWFENTNALIHAGKGTPANGDTFIDTAYNASSAFRLLQMADGTAADTRYLVMEESGTWDPDHAIPPAV